MVHRRTGVKNILCQAFLKVLFYGYNKANVTKQGGEVIILG
jgi:hypothetical protein